jgi:superfamily II DNA/RNA helicase
MEVSKETTPALEAATSFDELGLAAPILAAVKEMGYKTPTPIQSQAIPLVLAGRDLMAQAQTGTGKTAAFVLPLLQKMVAHANASASPARHPVRALVLAPTRELAIQVHDSVVAYNKNLPLRSTVVFGGVDMKVQIADLRGGVEILVATPGRLLDHANSRSVLLSQVQFLVLDEADRMLDMGFLPDLKRILDFLPTQRQTLLFSATFDDNIVGLARSFLQNPLKVEVARRNTSAENVEQLVHKVKEEEKLDALIRVVKTREIAQVLVFTRTKVCADKVGHRLQKRGIQAAIIHGDKAQVERFAALEGFKQGKVQYLVATDIAARGLDIVELPCVVNYELPYAPEDYVHRIGRTGRAGASGLAVSLVSPDEERLLAGIERFIKRDLNASPLPEIARPQEVRVVVAPSVAQAVPAASQAQSTTPSSPAVARGIRRRAEPVCALLMPPATVTEAAAVAPQP